MSKGSKPRNCFSKEYKDNYDDINWGKKDEDNASEQGYSIIEGMIRQTMDLPIDEDEKNCGCDENSCCANE